MTTEEDKCVFFCSLGGGVPQSAAVLAGINYSRIGVRPWWGHQGLRITRVCVGMDEGQLSLLSTSELGTHVRKKLLSSHCKGDTPIVAIKKQWHSETETEHFVGNRSLLIVYRSLLLRK